MARAQVRTHMIRSMSFLACSHHSTLHSLAEVRLHRAKHFQVSLPRHGIGRDCEWASLDVDATTAEHIHDQRRLDSAKHSDNVSERA